MTTSNRPLLFLLGLVLFIVPGCSSFAETDPFVPGEVVVQFVQGTPVADAQSLIEAEGLEWADLVNPHTAELNGPLGLVRVPVGRERQWIERLSALPQVRSASFNQIVSIAA